MFDYFYGSDNEKFLFYQIPVPLVKEKRFSKLSCEAKLLYGILLGKTRLSSRNGWLDEKGRVYVYYTIKEAKEDFGCANDKATKIFQELEDIGLIERKKQPNKPALVYVKNFDSGGRTSENRNSENRKPGIPKTGNPEFRKPEPIYIDINNIDINNNQSIYPGREEIDRSEIESQISYDCLLTAYDVPEDTLDFFVAIIADEYSNGDRSAIEKLRRLDMFDVLYVLDSISTAKPKVSNIRAYIRKCLVNAHDSRRLYYDIRNNSDEILEVANRKTPERGSYEDIRGT